MNTTTVTTATCSTTTVCAPEIDVSTGVVVLVGLAAMLLLVWERRRRAV